MTNRFPRETALLQQRDLTNRGGSGAPHISQRALVHAGGGAQLAHGRVQPGLDVRPGAHVLGLLLAPHQLRIAVLRHDLYMQMTLSSPLIFNGSRSHCMHSCFNQKFLPLQSLCAARPQSCFVMLSFML